MASQRRGADIVLDALKAGGVDTVFALSGNHIMSLFDAAFDGPRLIHVRHEAAAVHMADAYGRLTGRPGIAMATGGPGHANAVAGLFAAKAAESPLVLLSGHAPTDELGLGAFQELEQARLAEPVTKAAFTAMTVDALEGDIARALEIAVSGRPGPVHVSLPTDLIDKPAGAIKPVAAGGTSRVRQAPDQAAINAVTGALARAERPVLIAGPAMSRGAMYSRLEAVGARLALPVVAMESPRGLNDPSNGAFAQVLKDADLLVLVAKPMDFTLKFARPPHVAANCLVVSLDPDDDVRGRVAARGELGLAVSADPDAALGLLEALASNGPDRSTWTARVCEAVRYRPPAWAEIPPVPQGRVHPLAINAAVAKVLEAHPEALYICDGGEIGQWAQTVPHPKRLTNSVSGAIGACLPSAIAARVVDPESPIIAVMGDGTVGFYLAEFDTAVRYGLPLVVIVGNDACWNAEHQIQIRDYGADRTHGCELLPTRYDLVCEALGGKGILVTDASDMDAALEAALASGQPTCINVMLAGQAAPVIRMT